MTEYINLIYYSQRTNTGSLGVTRGDPTRFLDTNCGNIGITPRETIITRGSTLRVLIIICDCPVMQLVTEHPQLSDSGERLSEL